MFTFFGSPASATPGDAPAAGQTQDDMRRLIMARQLLQQQSTQPAHPGGPFGWMLNTIGRAASGAAGAAIYNKMRPANYTPTWNTSVTPTPLMKSLSDPPG